MTPLLIRQLRRQMAQDRMLYSAIRVTCHHLQIWPSKLHGYL
jgi:hypothetical protein